MIDTAVDNPDVLRELTRLKKNVTGKTNVRLVKIHSFEFALLSFEYLEQWVFAAEDELREKRGKLLEARKQFITLIKDGGSAENLNAFKSIYQFPEKSNSEKLAAKLLWEITRNTGFETDKSQVGSCFIENCCEWSDRQADDICGLDAARLPVSVKMQQIIEHSVLQDALKEAGLS